jgi:hypothetical protein
MAKGDIQRLYDRRALYFNRKAVTLGVRGWVYPDELAAKPLVCFYCDIALDHRRSEFDHQVAFDRGGWNTIDNIVRCCKKCNGEKFTKTPEEWAEFLAQSFVCPVCGRTYRPRYADWKQGKGKVCSRRCAASWRFMK